MRTPARGADIRIESGVREGDEVSIYYDPMIAKLVVWGVNRDAALARLSSALRDYQIVGPPTNISFVQRAVAHPAFKKGMVETSFIPVCAAVCVCVIGSGFTFVHATHFSLWCGMVWCAEPQSRFAAAAAAGVPAQAVSDGAHSAAAGASGHVRLSGAQRSAGRC
jgi:hypothetical protein